MASTRQTRVRSVHTRLLEAITLAGELARRKACEIVSLRREIYLGLYAGGARDCDAVLALAEAHTPIDTEFVRTMAAGMSAAPGGQRVAIDRRDGARAFFTLHGVTVHADVADGDCGDHILIDEPPFYVGRSPGFVSRIVSGHDDTSLRIYVSVEPRDAGWFIGPLFDALRDGVGPVAAKVLANPRSYFRADAGVIYLPVAARAAALAIVDHRCRLDDVRLRAVNPLGTRRVRGGIGWAESPRGDAKGARSFGEVVTDLIVGAVERYPSGIGSRQLSALIADHGRDPARPWAIRRGGVPILPRQGQAAA